MDTEKGCMGGRPARTKPQEASRDPSTLFIRFRDVPEAPLLGKMFSEEAASVAARSELFNYLEANQNRGARLTALYPERGKACRSNANWTFALPDASADRRLSALHVLTLADPADREWITNALMWDPSVESVRQPLVQDGLGPRPEVTDPPPANRQWAIMTCGFRKAWETLEVGDPPPPVAVIDKGNDPGNDELLGRITMPPIPQGTDRADSVHAGEVCGIIASRRDDLGEIDGCCQAPIELYNVCHADGSLDMAAYGEAIAAVTRGKARVLNISLGDTARDSDIEDQILDCVRRNIVVVAAMGDRGELGSPEVYPAAFDGVVAVGATTQQDVRPAWASFGKHMFISAPGQQILTVTGRNGTDTPSGTSYSAAFVSAAVSLMLRKYPSLDGATAREVLSQSVDTKFTGGHRTPDLGFGRLDMMKMLKVLDDMGGDFKRGSGRREFMLRVAHT
jgi:subtilisin family serine protease